MGEVLTFSLIEMLIYETQETATHEIRYQYIRQLECVVIF